MVFFVFLIGLILGSFYLVIATRLPKGEDVLTSRSRCDTCKKELKWYNLIPLFSYAIQRGKCSYCHAPISSLHFLCELVTGICFALCYWFFGFSYIFFVGIIVISLTIIIYISDFKYMIILDSPLVVGSILIFLLKGIYYGWGEAFYSLLCGISLFVIMLLVQNLGKIIFKKDALGGGDIKLSFVMGLVLNLQLGLVSLVLSTFLALPYSVASLYLVKKDEVAYGPFLAGAMLIVFFTMDKWQILFNFLLGI